MLLTIVQSLTSRIQVKGAAKVLFRVRGLFRSKTSVYPCYNEIELRLEEDVLYQWWYAINYSSFDVVKLLEKYLTSGSTVLDVGANIGYVTLNASRIVGPMGKVLAVDPQHSTLIRLRENIDLNHAQNVSVIPAALSETDGDAEFNAATDAGLSRLDNQNRNSFGMELQERYRVEVMTLDRVVAENLGGIAPNVIKIDVEGHEFQVLKGARGTLEQRKSVLIMEVNSGALNQNGIELADILQFLRAFGYEAHWIESHSADWFRLGRQPTLTAIEDDPSRTSGDIIAIPCQFTLGSNDASDPS